MPPAPSAGKLQRRRRGSPELLQISRPAGKNTDRVASVTDLAAGIIFEDGGGGIARVRKPRKRRKAVLFLGAEMLGGWQGMMDTLSV